MVIMRAWTIFFALWAGNALAHGYQGVFLFTLVCAVASSLGITRR